MNSPHSLSQVGENIYTWTELTYIKRVANLCAAVFSTASGPASRVFALLARWQQVFFFKKRHQPRNLNANLQLLSQHSLTKLFSEQLNIFRELSTILGEN